MSQQNLSGIIGLQPQNDIFEPDTVQRHPLGYKITVYDTFFGFRELIYAKSASALIPGQPVILGFSTTSLAPVVTATTMPTAIAQGKPFAVTVGLFSAANQFGWFIVHGFGIVAADSGLAADAGIFAHAAGRIGATGVGKQLVGINVVEAATKTVVKNCVMSSSTRVKVPDTDGWFIGMPLTGTGLTNQTIAHIGNDGYITLSAASTTSGIVSVTGTYNDSTIFWPVCYLDSPQSII